ncbi:hypothetical protein BCR43DRAFT_533682 [Syncephalastrum racemosum]|uniref:Gamma-secretase subunit PEN-2 n=1 Tax=Syncephalastrum racemosum TaxID=13706 RepID=A0A1X2HSG1_SYNRA|nr:hypothetical protein BCR43DRAFT_533682 [Syncephalastrum racemosum]
MALEKEKDDAYYNQLAKVIRAPEHPKYSPRPSTATDEITLVDRHGQSYSANLFFYLGFLFPPLWLVTIALYVGHPPQEAVTRTLWRRRFKIMAAVAAFQVFIGAVTFLVLLHFHVGIRVAPIRYGSITAQPRSG